MVSTSRYVVPVEVMPGARILVVEARYYEELADALLNGAKAVLDEAKVTYDILTVAGALEIPAMVAIALDVAENKNKPYEAVVVLGAVIRGETTHYDLVSEESCRGVMNLSIDRALPIGNGIVTVENLEQAWERVLADKQDKGGGAVRAALGVLAIRRKLEKERL